MCHTDLIYIGPISYMWLSFLVSKTLRSVRDPCTIGVSKIVKSAFNVG